MFVDEEREYYHRHYSNDDESGDNSDGKEVTVRFTTLVTGTFNGNPLKLRTKVMEANGKVMNCPPTSVSVTFAADGPEKGKIIKLVTDMVSSLTCQSEDVLVHSGFEGMSICKSSEMKFQSLSLLKNLMFTTLGAFPMNANTSSKLAF